MAALAISVAAAVALILAAIAGAGQAQAPDGSVAPAAGAVAHGPITNLPLPRFVSLRAETANARRGPSLSHRVDWTFLRRGLPLEITAEYGNWRRVRDAEGAGGWVHHTLLSGVRMALIRGEGPTPLRAGAGADAAVRAFAEPGVVARLEACEAEWCEVSAEGVSGWAPRGLLWGVGPVEAIE